MYSQASETNQIIMYIGQLFMKFMASTIQFDVCDLIQVVCCHHHTVCMLSPMVPLSFFTK